MSEGTLLTTKLPTINNRGNVREDFWECFKIFQRMFAKVSGESSTRFREILLKISWNVREDSGKHLERFWGILKKSSWGMFEKILENTVKHSGNRNLDLFHDILHFFIKFCSQNATLFWISNNWAILQKETYYMLLITTDLMSLTTDFLNNFFLLVFVIFNYLGIRCNYWEERKRSQTNSK